MLSIAKKIFGSANQRLISSLNQIVKRINALEEIMVSLSDEELSGKTNYFREQFTQGRTLDDMLVEAFAVVREMSRRVLGMRHFDVQLIGGIVLHRGMIAEMKTGEGKTLVATLAAYLNAISGLGVHIVTVNDYLAKRDSEWMGKIFNALGMRVGCITNDMDDDQRREVYKCDVVYSTNNELGFDYLRDNMKFSKDEMVHRGFNYAIVDEVDSILIDEARTPLIISGQVNQNIDIYQKINKLIYELSDTDYELDEKNKTVFLTEEGIVKVEKLLVDNNLISSDSSLYDTDNIVMMHYFDQSLRAHKLFTVDKDYIIKNSQVIIVDEFTGRMMEGRRYSDGLHQAIEAKENLKVNPENQTLASTTFQNYFRMYNKLSGMTGTASTESEEFWDIYKLQVVQIPTNVPVKRIDLEDNIYCTEADKYDALVDFIIECNKKLQPVLVGTISIEKSENLSKLLTKKNLKHSVLNARYHEQEAYIIAQAGRPGNITIATNMAGRGTDIQLGGNPEMLAKMELAKITDPKKISEKYHEIVDRVKKDKEIVLNAGGLCVIGTERHESRRIDNQLRGRSGRQGDPGLSKFFLSLEDDLLRIFGSDKVKGLLQKLGFKKNEVIQHPWVTRALEKAQNKVEARNYDIRKSLLKFDDVINSQRKVVFEHRNQILGDENYEISLIYTEFNQYLFDKIIPNHFYDAKEQDFNNLIDEIFKIYGVKLDINTITQFDSKLDLIQYINNEINKMFINKIEEINSVQDKLWDFVIKRIMILTLDQLWQEHLLALESLKYGINLRAIGQKDPLNEFKKESFIMLQSMLYKFQEMILQRLAHFNVKDSLCYDNFKEPVSNKIEVFSKVSRNSQCPCGSGKKYKHCHGVIN